MVTTISLKNDPTNEVWKLLTTTTAAKARVKRGYPSQFAEALPSLFSGDPRFHAMLRDAADILDSTIDHEPVHRFAPASGVSSSFSKMRTACGVMGTPAGHVLYDNELKRKSELKLTRETPLDWELKLLHELLDAMFEFADYRDLKVASKSSQGLPKVSYDKKEKVDDAMKLLAKGNFENFLHATERREGMRILNEFGVVYAYLQNYRGSPDSWGKVRKTPDLDYAVSGGKEGQLVLVDKTIIGLDGLPVEGIQANRPRLVMGMNNPINICISAWRAGTSNYYLNEYGYTWKHTGSEQIAKKLNDYLKEFPNGEIIGVDVGQFDASVMTWLRKEIFNYCRGRYISDAYAEMILQAAFAPVLQPETGDGNGAYMHGNPIKMETLPAPGLLSGFDFVSPEGKIDNVWQALCLIGHVKGPEYILGKVRNYLKGQLEVRMLNAGDDGLIMFPESGFSDKFFSDEVMKMSFFKIEPEASLQFLGFTFTKENGIIKGYNNVVSFVTGILCPERPWTSKLRAFWNVGLAEKFKVYKNSPSFETVLDGLDVAFKRRLPHLTSFRVYCERLIETNRHNMPELLSEADRQFVMNPDAIHYKMEESDVSKHLIDEFYSNIPRSHYEYLIGTHLLSRQI